MLQMLWSSALVARFLVVIRLQLPSFVFWSFHVLFAQFSGRHIRRSKRKENSYRLDPLYDLSPIALQAKMSHEREECTHTRRFYSWSFIRLFTPSLSLSLPLWRVSHGYYSISLHSTHHSTRHHSTPFHLVNPVVSSYSSSSPVPCMITKNTRVLPRLITKRESVGYSPPLSRSSLLAFLLSPLSANARSITLYPSGSRSHFPFFFFNWGF